MVQWTLLTCICLCLLSSFLLLSKHAPAPAKAAVARLAPVSAAPAPKKPVAKRHWYQIGKASWYGQEFQGKPTATGEAFNMHALTCAHRTLPLGSWLRVTNLDNKKTTLVRVNDRGPYVEDAIIDLSLAAAHKLHMLGRTRVRVEALSPRDPAILQAMLESPEPDTNPNAN